MFVRLVSLFFSLLLLCKFFHRLSHIQADKKVCDSEDCPTCGDICDVPKLNNTCEWGRMMSVNIIGKVSNLTTSMPYWRKRGVRNLLHHVPWSICKEYIFDDKVSCDLVLFSKGNFAF